MVRYALYPDFLWNMVFVRSGKNHHNYCRLHNDTDNVYILDNRKNRTETGEGSG